MNILTKLIGAAVVIATNVHDSQAADGLVQRATWSCTATVPTSANPWWRKARTARYPAPKQGSNMPSRSHEQSSRAHLLTLRGAGTQSGGHPDVEPLLQPQMLREHPSSQPSSPRGRLNGSKNAGPNRPNFSNARLLS